MDTRGSCLNGSNLMHYILKSYSPLQTDKKHQWCWNFLTKFQLRIRSLLVRLGWSFWENSSQLDFSQKAPILDFSLALNASLYSTLYSTYSTYRPYLFEFSFKLPKLVSSFLIGTVNCNFHCFFDHFYQFLIVTMYYINSNM